VVGVCAGTREKTGFGANTVNRMRVKFTKKGEDDLPQVFWRRISQSETAFAFNGKYQGFCQCKNTEFEMAHNNFLHNNKHNMCRGIDIINNKNK
jgi:hypothetical protein